MYAIIVIETQEWIEKAIGIFTTNGKYMEHMRIATQIITNYKWDNSHFAIENINGHIFKFNLEKYDQKDGPKPLKKFIINVWDDTGATKVVDIEWHQDMLKPIDPVIWKKVNKFINDYSIGIFHCSKCEKEINSKQNRYFAGIYCDKCWTDDSKGRSIKQQEAEETYD